MLGVIGFLIILAGILGGLYVGGWIMFIKPIIAACAAFDAGTLTGMIVGTTILKCIFASCVGTLIFVVCYYLGMWLLYKKK